MIYRGKLNDNEVMGTPVGWRERLNSAWEVWRGRAIPLFNLKISRREFFDRYCQAAPGAKPEASKKRQPGKPPRRK